MALFEKGLTGFFDTLSSPEVQGLLAGSAALQRPSSYRQGVMERLGQGLMAGSEQYQLSKRQQEELRKAKQQKEFEEAYASLAKKYYSPATAEIPASQVSAQLPFELTDAGLLSGGGQSGAPYNTAPQMQTATMPGTPAQPARMDMQGLLGEMMPRFPMQSLGLLADYNKMGTTISSGETLLDPFRNVIAQGTQKTGKPTVTETGVPNRPGWRTKAILQDGQLIPIGEPYQSRGQTITNILPGGKDAKDIPYFRKQVQETVKPYTTTIDAADNSLTMLNLSIKNNNPNAYQGARVQLAKAFGDSQITANEIKAAGGDPSLLGSFLDTTSTMFTGTPTVDTMKNMEKTLKSLKIVAEKKKNYEIGVQKSMARNAGFDDSTVNNIFDFYSGIPTINNDDDYNKLPSGTEFMAPDGTTRVKP